MPKREHVAKMLRADLATAREAWIADAGNDAAERIRREGSDFLRAEDHDGRIFDFHALRHTCGSWAAIGGASPKAIQILMRHSTITLTLDTYGHLLPDEAASTMKNPRIPQKHREKTGFFKRSERDSNPRDPEGPTGFQDRRVQPLCHRTKHAKDLRPRRVNNSAPSRINSIQSNPRIGAQPCHPPSTISSEHSRTPP